LGWIGAQYFIEFKAIDHQSPVNTWVGGERNDHTFILSGLHLCEY